LEKSVVFCGKFLVNLESELFLLSVQIPSCITGIREKNAEKN
jgi:hypothetical protein